MHSEQQTRKIFSAEKIIDNLVAGNAEVARRAKILLTNSHGTLPPHICVNTARHDMAEETLAKMQIS